MIALFLALGDWLATYAAHSTVLLLVALATTALLPRRYSLHADGLLKGALLLPLASSIVAVVVARWMAADVFTVRQPAGLPLGGREGEAIVVGAIVLWLGIAAVRLRSLRARYLGQIRDLGPRIPMQRTLRTAAMSPRGRPIVVTVTERCVVPLAFEREVCLPVRALRELSSDELRSVLAHELTHIQRRDPVWRAVIAVVTEAFFFQPLNRFAGRRVRELSEWICDARTVRQVGGSPLASALARVAEWSRDTTGRPELAASLLQRESLALRRVRAALGQPQAMMPVHKSFAVAGAALIVAAALFLPAVGVDASGTIPYTIHARDDAGTFTITLQRGRVLGVTIAGTPLPPQLIGQRGRLVAIHPPAGDSLQLRLTPRGGFTWRSRRVAATAPTTP